MDHGAKVYMSKPVRPDKMELFVIFRKSNLLLFCIMSFLVREIFFSASVQGESVILGKDDLTGNYVALPMGKKHPFVAWSKDEIANFRTHLYNLDKMYDGARYGWHHQQIGPLAKAKRGDPLSAAQVWQVTADRVMADTAGEYLLKKARHFNDEVFIGAGHWAAASDLKQSALVYDLIADSEVLSSDEDKEIKAYLSRALHLLRSLKPYYGSINNMGVHIDASAWAAALCIEDVDLLKELFQRLKKIIGQGILPHGYWYEGTAYGNMVGDWMSDLAEYGDRSDIDLAHLHVKRIALSPKWNFADSYAQMGELFTWPFRVITPFMDIPNIGDGPKPSKLESFRALKTGKYSDDAELAYGLYMRDVKLDINYDPHKWGDFPLIPMLIR